MTKKAKLILFPILGTIVAASVITPIALVSANKHNKTKIVEEDKKIEKNEYSSFPKLDAKKYYHFIKIDKKEPYFDSKIVSSIIKDVLMNLKDYDQKVEFDYEFVNKKTLIVKFKIKFNDLTQSKKYKFEITNTSLKIN